MGSAARWLPFLVVVPLIGFGLWRRISGTFTAQQIVPWRMALRMAVLSVVATMLLVVGASERTFAVAAGALVVGVSLAVVSLSRTTFELRQDGVFYRADRAIGLLVTLLFVGRIVMRFVQLSEAPAGATPFAGMSQSPWTVGLFVLLAGYYVAYYAGVLRRGRRLT